MRRVTRGEWELELKRLHEMAMDRASNKRLKSAREYGERGFMSSRGPEAHFHFWGCESNKFFRVKAVCIFKKFMYGSYRYFIDEHRPYDGTSICREKETNVLSRFKIKR